MPALSRRRVLFLVPPAVSQVYALLELALDDLDGPDPESALWYLKDASATLVALLKTLPPA